MGAKPVTRTMRRRWVHELLAARPGHWLDSEAFTQTHTGGKEGLAILRELRTQGIVIEERENPDIHASTWQYRLATAAVTVQPVLRPFTVCPLELPSNLAYRQIHDVQQRADGGSICLTCHPAAATSRPRPPTRPKVTPADIDQYIAWSKDHPSVWDTGAGS